MGATKPRSVSIVYPHLPEYRVDFFCRLKEALSEEGIDLNLVFGKNRHTLRQDERELDWATPVNNVHFIDSKNELIWQPVPDSVYKSDLIVLLQVNKILSNHLVFVKSRLRRRKIALWGHGVNRNRPDPGTLGNRLKRLYSTRVDWWFAYTSGVADEIARMGFPKERITIVQNAIDTSELLVEAQKIQPGQIEAMKKELGIGRGPVGIYCGGMYKEKRLEFLLQACSKIRERIPSFEMIFVGAGSDSSRVERASYANSWIHYVGPQFGFNRIPYFKMADLFLIPGAVGLAILDSFALETPMVTTDIVYHGPEIEYLNSGENGLITENTIEEFVNGVQKVLCSDGVLNNLREACRRSAPKYDVEIMVNNFAEGVQKALASG